MDKEFVAPNIHVVLVHYPLGLLVCGLLIELFGFLWKASSFRTAGRWMILLGAITALPTALSGTYALEQVSSAKGWNAAQEHSLKIHLILESSAAVAAMLIATVWIGCSDKWRLKLHLPLLVLLLGTVGAAGAGAWYAGEAVYRFNAASMSDQPPPTTAEFRNPTFFLPPLEAHVILAGFAFAVALAALGLSIRRISQGPGVTHFNDLAEALGTQDSPPIPPDPAGAPAARFWLLAFLFGAMTLAAAYWYLGSTSNTWSVTDMWRSIITQNSRSLAHVITGGSIAVLILLLAAAARWMPRRKWVLIFLALILVVAVGLQVWFGVLLMFDSMQGPLTRFN